MEKRKRKYRDEMNPEEFNRYRQAFADWVATKINLQAFATLTFKDEIGVDLAWKKIIKWLLYIRDRESWNLHAFIVLEETPWRSVQHAHVAIGHCEPIGQVDYEQRWTQKNGLIKWEKAREEVQPFHYMTKQFQDERSANYLLWDLFWKKVSTERKKKKDLMIMVHITAECRLRMIC